jgi:hypothetical protein
MASVDGLLNAVPDRQPGTCWQASAGAIHGSEKFHVVKKSYACLPDFVVWYVKVTVFVVPGVKLVRLTNWTVAEPSGYDELLPLRSPLIQLHVGPAPEVPFAHWLKAATLPEPVAAEAAEAADSDRGRKLTISATALSNASTVLRRLATPQVPK